MAAEQNGNETSVSRREGPPGAGQLLRESEEARAWHQKLVSEYGKARSLSIIPERTRSPEARAHRRHEAGACVPRVGRQRRVREQVVSALRAREGLEG